MRPFAVWKGFVLHHPVRGLKLVALMGGCKSSPKFRTSSPRKGTETLNDLVDISHLRMFRTSSPRKGTETHPLFYIYAISHVSYFITP